MTLRTEEEQERLYRLAEEQGFIDSAAIAAMQAGLDNKFESNALLAYASFKLAKAMLDERRENMVQP